MRLCVLFGIPASGKTTFARKLGEGGWRVHSYDDARLEHGDSCTTAEVERMYFAAVRRDLLAGYDIVCDCKCISVEVRKRILDEFADIPCHRMLVAMVTPLDECVKRNAQREKAVPKHHIEIAAKYMQPPTEAEGWDEVLVLRG